MSKPTPEQMVVLDVQFGEKQKAKGKTEEDTITESTVLHGLSTSIGHVYTLISLL